MSGVRTCETCWHLLDALDPGNSHARPVCRECVLAGRATYDSIEVETTYCTLSVVAHPDAPKEGLLISTFSCKECHGTARVNSDGLCFGCFAKRMQHREDAALRRRLQKPVEVEPQPRLEENADRVDGHVHRLICRLRNELSDRCGALETEKRDLEVENSQLRRQVERLERRLKGGVR